MAARKRPAARGGVGSNQYGVKGASRARAARDRADTFAAAPEPEPPPVNLTEAIEDAIRRARVDANGHAPNLNIGAGPLADVLESAKTCPLPELTASTARAYMLKVAATLNEAGMPRTSRLNGAELTGFTTSYGSTGFSLRDERDGRLAMHVVISGKAAGLHYRRRDDGHEPINPERLHPRIRAALGGLGVNTREIRFAGWQLEWDDDVEYEIVVDDPRSPEQQAADRAAPVRARW